MIRFENVETYGWEAAIRGMRNPKNSWEKSDSRFIDVDGDCYDILGNAGPCSLFEENLFVGPNDHKLMMQLCQAGPVHRKFMRMIQVSVDITAPLYWWKEFDTYKVGTVANSCSTMHKIAEKEFTLEDFSTDHIFRDNCMTVCNRDDFRRINNIQFFMWIIDYLNLNRELYLKTKDKDYWWQMIQLLPSSYNQKRTVLLNYEVLANIYQEDCRRHHKLDEWCEHNDNSYFGFCDWIKTLPYSELITGEVK